MIGAQIIPLEEAEVATRHYARVCMNESSGLLGAQNGKADANMKTTIMGAADANDIVVITA